jgi:hypothetical protein
MKKIVHLGTHHRGRGIAGNVFAKIELSDDGKLSISGVEGPRESGNCSGSCGQIIIGYKEYDERGHSSITDIDPAPDWTLALIKQFFDVWDKWHLNDMRAGCEHQRKWGWTYEEHHNRKTFKGHKCRVCKYHIGSAWLKEELPPEVVEFLEKLPVTDVQPAWV